jgi:serine protease Do
MKAVTAAGIALIIVGLVAVAAVYAPTALGQVRALSRTQDEPLVRVFASGDGYIGVSIRDVEKADVEREKLPGPSGAVIDEVRSGSPAEKAGLKAGDVVIEYDGEHVRSARQFARLVEETPEGRAVKATVMRAGKRVDVEVAPQSGSRGSLFGADLDRLNRDLRMQIRPELDRLREFRLEPFAFDFGGQIRTGRLGITGQDLSPQLAEYFGVKEGVLVASVTPDSAAAKAGLKAGDVITTIDGEAVARVSDVRRRVERLDPGDAFTIAIVRDKKAQTLQATLEEQRIRRRVVSSL